MNNISNYLPSRHLRIAILVLVLGGALVTWGDDVWQFAQRLRAPGSSLPEPLAVTNNEARALKDTDGDGVEDWEEVLLGLNPNVRDSDGDGVTDDQEREQRRALLGEARIAELERLSDGDKIGLQLAARIEQNEDAPLSTLTGEELQSFAASQATALKQYSRIDLVIDPGMGIETQKAYAGRMQTILNSSDMVQDSDLEAIGAFFGNLGSPSFRATTFRAQSMTQRLLETPVPSSAVSIHLELLNNYYAFFQLIESLDQLGSDEIKEYITFSLLQGSIEGIFQTIQNFDGYFLIALDEKMY